MTEQASGFFKRWIEGMKNLSPERQVEAQISFGWGNLIGFMGGFITMMLFMFGTGDWKQWWIALVLILAFASTIVDLIGKKQLLKQIRDSNEQMKTLENMTL